MKSSPLRLLWVVSVYSSVKGQDSNTTTLGGDMTEATQGEQDERTASDIALQETNKFRAMHSAVPLTIDSQLSGDCQDWAEMLAELGELQHSCNPCSAYSENLWMGTTSGSILGPMPSAQMAIMSWYNEMNNYNWSNPGFSQNTGHFTALVWKGSMTLGIGFATNEAKRSSYIVARYVPPGNVLREFAENVGPLPSMRIA